MAQDPLSQTLSMAEDLRVSIGDTVDSVLSQGAEQVKRVAPAGPAAPGLAGGSSPGGSSPGPELPQKFPELPELGELPELPSPPEAPKAGGSSPETTGMQKKTTRRTKGQVEGF